MNSPVPPVIKSERRLARWLLIGLAILVTPLIVVGFGVISMFTLDGDAAALRREVAAATEVNWQRKIQLSVGWATLGAVRTGLGFAHHEHMDEARLALAAVRRASVGVYQRTGHAGDWSHEQLFARTDRVMRNRGWSRLVGVADHGETVLVYASDKIDSDNRLELCVAVIDGDELVVVSTRVDAGKLLELAELKMPAGGFRSKLKLAGL